MPFIRQARLGDLPGIASLEREIFGADGHSVAVIRQLFDLFPTPMAVAACGAGGREIVGYSLAGRAEYRRAGWILALGSHPAYRRQGLGRALSEQTIAAFRKLKIREVFLTVFPDNAAARALYLSLGFSEVRTVDNYFFDGSERLLMSLCLS